MIIVDDLRWDALGATGSPLARTPNLDRISESGAVFKNAFVVTSLCSPSRATLLTGLYPHVTGVINNVTALPTTFETIGQYLQRGGYETAFIGKWHMGLDARPQAGFDNWVVFPGQGAYVDPTLNVNGTTVQGHGHVTDILTDYAQVFMAKPRTRPFFLVLSHKAVHQPWIAQYPYLGTYAHVSLQAPATFGEDLSGKPLAVQQWAAKIGLANDTAKLFRIVRGYYETLAGMDESTGRVLRELDLLGLADNTLVIVISDNGYILGEHNLVDKRLAYEESIRIPLVVRYPAWFDAGDRIDNFALNLDIAPTILDAAGLPIPTAMQGMSLRRVASETGGRSSFFYEYFWNDEVPLIPNLRAIRTHDYVYVNYDGGAEELYDLRTDSLQRTNVATDARYSPTLLALRQQLIVEGRAVGYPF